MEVQLKVLVGGSAGQVIKVAGSKFLIGRDEDCQLRPRSDVVSRHHCAIIVEGRYVALRDFGSKNGTFVNDQRVTGEQELEPGDQVKIGPLEFEILLDESLGAKKRPKVTSIKEAAARTAESSPGMKDDEMDMDVDGWLNDGSYDGAETRALRTNDTMEISNSETSTSAPIPPPKTDEPAKPRQKKPREKKPPGKLPPPPKPVGDSDQAAADMLRKMKKFR